jgi:hypothetical protein
MYWYFRAIFLTFQTVATFVLVAEFGNCQESSPADEHPLAKFKPQWQVGQTWIVETTTTLLQHGDDLACVRRVQTVRWSFQVEQIEPVLDEPCFRLIAKPVGLHPQGMGVRLWATVDNLTLRRVEIDFIAAGETRTLCETFQGLATPTYPAQAPFVLLPLDLPCWETIAAKEPGVFSYEVIPGDPEKKEPGGLRFRYHIEQKTVDPAQLAKGQAGTDGKAITGERIGIELKTPLGQVKQVWQSGQPWPIWATNGRTQARLILEEVKGER